MNDGIFTCLMIVSVIVMITGGFLNKKRRTNYTFGPRGFVSTCRDSEKTNRRVFKKSVKVGKVLKLST